MQENNIDGQGQVNDQAQNVNNTVPVVENSLPEQVTAPVIVSPPASSSVVMPAQDPSLNAVVNPYFNQSQPVVGVTNNASVVNPAPVFNNQPIAIGSSNPKVNIGKIIKIVLIAIAAIGVLIGGYFAIKYFFLDNSKAAIENKALELKYAQDRPIEIKKDGLYGFIDTNGKTIIEPKYTMVVEGFHGDFAYVAKKDGSSDASYYNNNDYFIINKSGEEKVKADYGTSIEYIEEYSVWIINSRLYDEKLNPITGENYKIEYIDSGYISFKNDTDKTFGIMNMRGDTKFVKNVTEGDSFLIAGLGDRDSSLKEVYGVITMSESNEAIVNFETGKVVYDFGQKNVIEEDDNIFELYDNDNPDDNQMIYVAKDKIVFQTEKNKIVDLEFYNFNDQILKVEYGYSNYKYYDIKNDKLLDKAPSGYSSSSQTIDIIELEFGYKQMDCSNKKGIIKGEDIILPCEYDRVTFITSEVFKYVKNKTGKEIVVAENGDKYSIIDLRNKSVLKTFDVGIVSTSQYSVFLSNDYYSGDETITVFNMINNKSADFDKDSDINYSTNYFTVKKDGKKAYYNGDFKKIYEE